MVPLMTLEQFQEERLKSMERQSLLEEAVQKMVRLHDEHYQASLTFDGAYEKVAQGIKVGRLLRQMYTEGSLFATIGEHDICLLEPLCWHTICSLISEGGEPEMTVILRILNQYSDYKNTDPTVLRGMLTKIPLIFPRLYFFYVTPAQEQYILPVQFLQELRRQRLREEALKQAQR
eukprot:TRINITY_DN3298_c1_g1_i3.p1 TRINITY_DN3298_c1_g1~~TRINITY_DN3298_c1_g1_i3.p1  ORF type:complete len:176 (-),score=18.26 TRINITY_DN3298_c1_g1_i3:303-830(-)